MTLPARGEPRTPDAAGAGVGGAGRVRGISTSVTPEIRRQQKILQELERPLTGEVYTEEGSLPGQAESQGHHGPVLD